jgi:hypothetical protein
MSKKKVCSICEDTFKPEDENTFVGTLGPIPVRFCAQCQPKVMMRDTLILSNEKRNTN